MTWYDIFQKYITDMSDDQFKDNIEALTARRLEQPKTMLSQNAKYWSEIVSQQYNFDRGGQSNENMMSFLFTFFYLKDNKNIFGRVR